MHPATQLAPMSTDANANANFPVAGRPCVVALSLTIDD